MPKDKDVTEELLSESFAPPELSEESKLAANELRAYIDLHLVINHRMKELNAARRRMLARLVLIPQGEEDAFMTQVRKMLADAGIPMPDDDDELRPVGEFDSPFGRVQLFKLH